MVMQFIVDASSQSKRPAIYPSNQTVQTLSDAANRTNIEELRKSLPSDKKLMEGCLYLVRKSKRKATYWEHYLKYLEDGKLRAECKFYDKTFAADGNLN